MLVQEDTRGQPVSSLSKVGSSLLSSSTIAGEVRLKNVHLQHKVDALPSGRGLAGSHPGRVQPLLDLLAPQLGGDVVSSTSTAQMEAMVCCTASGLKYLYSLKAVVSSSTKLAKFCLSS